MAAVEKTPPYARPLVSSAVPVSPVMSSGSQDDAAAWYKCKHCSDQFKREDHLRRHELSHGFPRFLCDHGGCGMRFHRKDVLQRHKLVHQPNPLKRRRKPRRGPIPRGPIQQSDVDVQPAASIPSLPAASHHHAVSSSQPPSPPQDMQLFNNPVDSFNLTNEWDYGIQEWPEYAMHVCNSTLLSSWQDFVMPVYDTTAAPHAPPSLALAHAPNAAFAMFHHPPTLPMGPQEMQTCVDKFRQRFLPRIPFLHYLTCERESMAQDSALYYTMAMAGSLYLDEYRSKAARMHKLASETLQRQTDMGNAGLAYFQAKILLIDFAVWYGDDDARKRACRDKQALAQPLIDFVQATLPPLTYDDWDRWRLREEIKRTSFAFFVSSVIHSAFYAHQPTPTPLPNTIPLSLPSPEPIWESTTPATFHAHVSRLALRSKTEILFPTAAHALLSHDTTHATDYELATIYGQLILLCVILNAFTTAKNTPTSYASPAAHAARDMSAFLPRPALASALDLWTELWWASPECLWDATMPAHPRIENIFLHQHIAIQLHKNAATGRGRAPWTYRPVECATAMFVSISKSGFTEVATYASHILSLSVYYIGVDMARTMAAFLGALAAPGYGPLTPRDGEIVTRIRQAVRRHIPPPSTTTMTTAAAAVVVTKQEALLGAAPVGKRGDEGGMAELIARAEEIWSLGLGGLQWKEDESCGVAVAPKDQQSLRNVDGPAEM